VRVAVQTCRRGLVGRRRRRRREVSVDVVDRFARKVTDAEARGDGM
jgi:hypothetical protein